MKGYILIENRNDREWYYLTIQTPLLQPVKTPILDAKFAKYYSSNFIIQKITSCHEKNRGVTEIKNGCGIDSGVKFGAKIGETKNNLPREYIFKTRKSLFIYLRYLNQNFIQNGWITIHNMDGSINYKWYLKRNKKIKAVSYGDCDCDDGGGIIISTNFKKNETCVVLNSTIIKYPFIAIFYRNQRFMACKEMFYHASSILSSSGYTKCGEVQYRHRYIKTQKKDRWTYLWDGNQPYHGIIYNSDGYENGVYWFAKFISLNLQTWYQTPLNFTLRIHKIKIKCF
jgi:hypothetical protein